MSIDPLVAMIPRRVGGMPTSAFLQLSDRCNHACLHCYQVHGERGELSTGEVKQVMDDLAASGVLFLTLSGGEITLRPDLLELVAHARALRFAVRIFTNAYLVDDDMARRLAELSVLDVNVSLYSGEPAVHDGITQVPGSFVRTIEGVRALRKHGVAVVLKLTIMNANADSYRGVIDLAKDLGCGYVIGPNVEVREDGHCGPAQMRASDEQVLRILHDPDVPIGRIGERPKAKSMDALACGACATATVMPDGTVRPCTNLPYSLGNVRERSIAEAYRDSEVVKFVLGLKWSDLPACAVCDLRDYCSRCHAAALLEDGDVFGPATTSCGYARTRYHYLKGSCPDAEEPRIGPFEVSAEGKLKERAWDPAGREVPETVPLALVMGGPRHRKVRLRVLAG